MTLHSMKGQPTAITLAHHQRRGSAVDANRIAKYSQNNQSACAAAPSPISWAAMSTGKKADGIGKLYGSINESTP